MARALVTVCALLALAACDRSSPKAERAEHSFDLPSSRAELIGMLDTAAPELATAIKGAIRQLDGAARLSFARVAVVGASLSAGFGGLPLSTALDEAIAEEHEISAPASTFFFKSPIENGALQIESAVATKATVVVAIDILFWYAYANGSLEYRMRRLEEGLHNLERLRVPLIIGDIPDMRTGAPWMLPPEVVPPPEQLAVLNERVHEWARKRLNVHMVPLARWSAVLASDGKIEVESGKSVPAKSLVHMDGLHPNPQGVRYMLLRLDPSLEIGFPDTPAKALVF